MALTAYSVALRLRSSWYSLDIVIVNAVLLIWAALCFYGVYNDKTGYMKANIGLFALFAAAYVVLGILSVIYGGNLGFAFVSLVFAAIAVSAATATWRHLKSFDTVTTTATATVIQPPYTV
ncbi:hypothetical protein JKP88DRAFT_280999 [Tribonema minus]|uniref:Uncharacterized protein n=1 Tax=Tribonema minus TaxID=303371 RepID=A0A835YRI1_9STRA|nr:hypothetical protein JKP88DRAFT_280999 [Tribonema minus]